MDLKKKKNGEEVCYVEVVRLRVEKKKKIKGGFVVVRASIMKNVCGCVCRVYGWFARKIIHVKL